MGLLHALIHDSENWGAIRNKEFCYGEVKSNVEAGGEGKGAAAGPTTQSGPGGAVA